MTQTSQKTAFVFAGGGSLGAIQVGMLRSLLSADVQPDFVIGTSVGAQCGLFCGYPKRGGGGEARGNLVRPATYKGWRSVSRRDLRSTQSSQARRIFPPVRIDGEMLMDGAIANNTPIVAAADLGASRIVVLPTGYACALQEPPKGVIAKVLHAITLLIAGQLIRDFERLADEVDVDIVPTLCPLAISPYDFSTSP